MTTDGSNEAIIRRRWGLIAVAVLAVPVVIIALLARAWSHGAPCFDEWLAVDAFRRSTEGQTVWPEFFNQRTLHIVPVEALGTHLAFLWLDGDMRYLCALAIVLVAATAWMLWRLARPLLASPGGPAGVATAAWIGFALFSPLHAEIWQWGLCWPVTVPLAALCAGILILQTNLPVAMRVAALVCLSVFSFLSYSGGLPVGPALWLAIVFSSASGIPRKRTVLITWTVVLAALGCVLAAKFDPAQLSQARGDSIGPSPSSLPMMFQSFLALLGHPLSLGTTLQSVENSVLVGGIISFLVLVLALQLLWMKGDDCRRDVAAPWLAIMAFAIANALLLAVTRGARTSWLTYTPRYLVLTTPAVLGAVLLFAWAWRCRLIKLPEAWRVQCLCATGGLLAAVLAASWAEGITWMKLWHVRRLQSEALLTWSQVLPWRLVQSTELAMLDQAIIPDAVKFLHARGALAGVNPVPDGRLDRWRQMERPMPDSYARCTSAMQLSDGSLAVEGYADNRGRGRPSDLVVLARVGADGVPVAVTAAVPMCPADYYHFDLDRKRDYAHNSRWHMTVLATDLPEGTGELQTWAIDVQKREARPILPAFAVDGTRRPARPEYLLPFAAKSH